MSRKYLHVNFITKTAVCQHIKIKNDIFFNKTLIHPNKKYRLNKTWRYYILIYDRNSPCGSAVAVLDFYRQTTQGEAPSDTSIEVFQVFNIDYIVVFEKLMVKQKLRVCNRIKSYDVKSYSLVISFCNKINEVVG